MVTETIAKLTFQQVTNITNNPLFLVGLGICWLVPLVIYILWGAIAKAKTSDGRQLKSSVIDTSNFWIGFCIISFTSASLLLVTIVYPVWLLIFN